MPNNNNLWYALLAGALVLVAVIFFWNNYQVQIQTRIDKPIEIPKTDQAQCGIENCYGLDITCGPNIPEACTMLYMAGDNCRQFAVCAVMDGQCRQVISTKFNDCKNCVQKCEQNFKNDQIKFFECESGCAGI